MKNFDEFKPEQIEEQIEQLAQATAEESSSARVVQALQSFYARDVSMLEQVWRRLEDHQAAQAWSSAKEKRREKITSMRYTSTNAPQKHTPDASQNKQESRQASPFIQSMSRLVALLAVALIVGSLALVFALRHVGTNTGSGISLNSTPGWGKVLHTQTASGYGLDDVTWSPDSKRVAASNAAIPGSSSAPINDAVQIWDATTGQHLVTVPVHDNVFAIAWSPNSQQIAIATLQNIIIVDSQSGNTLNTIPVLSQSQPSAFASSGMAPLSDRIPASGGAGFRDLAWSPDGSQIATSLFGGSAKGTSVLIWNLQTGTSMSLQVKSGNDLGEGIAWSSNSKYIAADTFQTASGSLTESGVTVWNVATQQVVLQKFTGSTQDAYVTLAWQPGTLNLAQIGSVKVGNNNEDAILIFNGTTGKTVKQLVVPVSGVLTWSPNGKYLAYTSPSTTDVNNSNTAQILDASTWKVVFTYQDDQDIVKLAWSPDGHYVATDEIFVHNSMNIGLVKVWQAPV